MQERISRTGRRIQAAIGVTIQIAIRNGDIGGGDFLHLPSLPALPGSRSEVNFVGLRSAEMLPPLEIDAAILKVIEAIMGGTDEQAMQAVSRLLGLKATSSNIREVIIRQIPPLLQDEQRVVKDGFLCQHHSGHEC